jgi:cytochrome d ubiquinol oxidase subunit I
MRTAEGTSPQVSAGNTLFTLLGFSGLYLVMGILFLYLVGREVAHGPGAPHAQVDVKPGPALAGRAA